VGRKLTVVALAVAGFLISAVVAFAATSTYRGPMYWSCYCDGNSSYASGWIENWFVKNTSGVSDTMVTLIDNGALGYSWHGTVRSTASAQKSVWASSYVKKGYCRFYSGTAFNGSCFVAS
jgi:hypothetical protein